MPREPRQADSRRRENLDLVPERTELSCNLTGGEPRPFREQDAHGASLALIRVEIHDATGRQSKPEVSGLPRAFRFTLHRLKIHPRPYSGPSLARGISLMYRRNKTNGTWVLKSSDGHGAYWTKGFALADDFENADGKSVLTFYQAQDATKKLARGENGSAGSAPITVDSAL